MNRRLITTGLALTILLVTANSAHAQVADARKFLICQTGSVATAEEAQPYIDGFGSYLAKQLGWEEGTFGVQFENQRKGGLAALKDWSPAFATLSLGIFLEYEKRFNLMPLVVAKVNGKTTNKFYVLVAKGSAKTLTDLKGKTLSGSIVDDVPFLSRVVFGNTIDAATHFTLKQTKRPLRDIRKVSQGKLDAILVDDMQFQSLKGLPLFAQLDVIYESTEVPNLGMVYVTGRATDGDVNKFAKALVDMCREPEGKKMCETFAVEGFEPVPAGALDGVRALYK